MSSTAASAPATPAEDPGPRCPGHQAPKGEEPDRRPYGRPVWCPDCAVRIRGVLAGLGDLVSSVSEWDDGQLNAGRVETGRVTPSSTPRSVSPASDVEDELVRWVVRTEDELLEHLGLGRRVRTDAFAFGPALRNLVEHVTPLLVWDTRREYETRRWRPSHVPIPPHWPCLRCRQPRSEADAAAGFAYHRRCEPYFRPSEAEVVGRRVLKFDFDLHRAAGLEDLVHRLEAPCPRCDLLTLVRADGEERVRCSFCRAEWQEHEYQRLVLVLLSTHGKGSS